MTTPESPIPEASPRPPRLVSRFEANLLRILRFFFRETPADQALQLISHRPSRPTCLSSDAIRLIEDTLAKGCIRTLARRGGWRRERFLRGGIPREGRLWERSPIDELQLQFSREIVEFLLWLTTGRLSDPKPAWGPSFDRLTLADQLVLFLAFEVLHHSDQGPALRSHRNFFLHPLCRLAYPQEFMAASGNPVNFEPWFTPLGVAILECLQSQLRANWVTIERGKQHHTDWNYMRALGQSQERILGQFFDALQAHQRIDLARWVLQTAADLLPTEVAPSYFLGGLQAGQPPTRLADRLEIQRLGLAFFRSLERLQTWQRQARSAGYLDEDYQVYQLWKSLYEQYDGDGVMARANSLLRQLEPLKVAPTPNTGGT